MDAQFLSSYRGEFDYLVGGARYHVRLFLPLHGLSDAEQRAQSALLGCVYGGPDPYAFPADEVVSVLRRAGGHPWPLPLIGARHDPSYAGIVYNGPNHVYARVQHGDTLYWAPVRVFQAAFDAEVCKRMDADPELLVRDAVKSAWEQCAKQPRPSWATV